MPASSTDMSRRGSREFKARGLPKRSKLTENIFIKRVAHWLLRKQIDISFQLVVFLLLTHLGVPALRPYTSKFFRLSYCNQSTEKYGIGYDDLYFIAFWIILLTGLRASCMKYILAPLSRRWGVSKAKDATRFAEQGWISLYYSMMWTLGMYLYYKSPYFLNMEELWTEWPQREMDGLVKAYYLGQLSFWIQQVLVINIEDRRKDHWQMLTHHFVTISLMATSYVYHQTKVGHLILVLMDVIDLFLPLAKCLKYLGFTTICDILFGLFIVSWLFARHLLFLITCWSIYTDFPRIVPPGCYRGTAKDLQGPFPVPENWGYLIEPFYDPAGTVCMNNTIMYSFLSFLLLLQVLMVIWFAIIARIAIRVLEGRRADDPRSDGEQDELVEKEQGNNEAPQGSAKNISRNAVSQDRWQQHAGERQRRALRQPPGSGGAA
ncbi:longevity-assurance protein [Aspergillus welwitschiae]|uniref:Longevity-assurance protein n=2 Tax=Aspergillus TaxID=5052 RepID=A0A3F3PME3_9EURO|nr:longevity-assurance protein [Aspergillus welwitschiae]RDH28089.1 longevity-assurance protein [Aspergillus welwitschiae]